MYEDSNEQVYNQEEQVEQSQGTPQETGEQPEFGLDKEGNLQWNTDEYSQYNEEDSEDEQPSEEETEKQVQTTEEEPKYTVKVNGEDVEVTQEELLRGYMRQSDYTRKTQALADERQRMEQYYRQPQYNHQPQEQVPQQNGADLNSIAKQIAARNLGLDSPDDLSELDFDHITAVVEAKQALLNQRNQMMNREQSINNLEAQLRQEEPEYDRIMESAQEAMTNLPYREFVKLQRAYEAGDAEPLRQFFHTIQKDYYSKAIKKNEQSKKTVPVVERSGNTPVTQGNIKKRFDFKKLGTMTSDEKAQLLIKMGIV